MTDPIPDPDFAARIRSSFDRQAFMQTAGARLVSITPRTRAATRR